ncbi:adenine phosphoribosyltransferase [archaeon]|nr:adenine phosphoribosyltransferase [archaeon]
MAEKASELRQFIRSVPDYPKKGIMFRDITTLLKEPNALNQAIGLMEKEIKARNLKVDKIAGIESRGFIFGSILASRLGKGFVPLRKKGKLPAKTISHEYTLEYGKDCIELHEDAIGRGEKVLVVDDLLATGGTAEAAVRLVEKAGGKVAGLAFLVELSFLNGRKKLEGHEVAALVDYKDEKP